MFDGRTGQVFEERVVKIQSQNDYRNWHKKTPTALCQKYKSSGTSAYRNYCKLVEQNRSPTVTKGPRTLLYMSINVLLFNLRSLPPGTLKHIPPHLLGEIARVAQGRFAELGPLGSFPDEFFDLLPLSAVEEMWTAINQRAQLNLDTWKKISKRLLSEKRATVKELGLRRYHQEIESPGPELSLYIGPVTSVSFDFLTSLTITTWYPIRDLVNIADVVNLGILQVYEPEESTIVEHNLERLVPDRLLRAWAERAVEKGAFSVLRILKFHVLEGGLTNGSLRHFNSFPALGLVYPGRKGMSESVSVIAKDLGWRVLSDSTTLIDGSRFNNGINVVEPQKYNGRTVPMLQQAWHVPFVTFAIKEPRSWDGCEVTAIPSQNRQEFLAALETAGPPTHRLSGEKLDAPHLHNRRDHSYCDFVQGESWNKTDWDLFCETLGWQRLDTMTDEEVHCLDQFYSFTYLRLDSDLRDAGVKECGAGIVSLGDTFKSIISTTPIVSILLGQRKRGTQAGNPSRTKTWHFLRTNIPERAPNPDQSASNPPVTKTSTAPPKSSKRPESEPGRKMRPAKVQKFGDFFGAL
ncbi:hypothetical protein VE03_01349 [Pseudogymnoascus sp. 23342-1-I1]|nr:hypothetical protein VE03_01349 [Pseudogymnoascus sp. 23342-1-I1]